MPPLVLALLAIVAAEDVLTPYGDNRHGPSHGYRRVRDIQTPPWGSVTYEEHRPSNDESTPLSRTEIIIDDAFRPPGSPPIMGRISTINLPDRTLSVLEPGGREGGCGVDSSSWPIRATVVETARRANGCLVAMNAGFFRVRSGQCLGALVSNGRLVRTSNDAPNAVFGVRRDDGALVTGYVNDTELNRFSQLISGVVWLVRRGANYVDESAKAESDDNEGTGTMRRFVDVVSARTAIGHDANGHVVFVQIDGQTDRRGVDLRTFADFLVRRGLVNAINLDGGGSATTVLNGTLVNYPSDQCFGYRCARKVSTVVCAHMPQCSPPDCNGRGTCHLGRCHCTAPWGGDACLDVHCSDEFCNGRGTCRTDAEECECFVAGYTGRWCSQTCSRGFYGIGCNQSCPCTHYNSCSPYTGSCSCMAGWTGPRCNVPCPTGWYGKECLERCPECSFHGTCLPTTGECNCSEGWKGDACDVVDAALPTSRLPENAAESSHSASNKTTIALALSLGLSMLINFIFVILKFYSGKRNYSVDLDRTNFALR